MSTSIGHRARRYPLLNALRTAHCLFEILQSSQWPRLLLAALTWIACLSPGFAWEREPPTITKAFGAATIPVNGTTSLSFTIRNPNSWASLSGIGFTDRFPAGMATAKSGRAYSDCPEGRFDNGTEPGSTNLSFSGASLPPNRSCTVSIDVTVTTAGEKFNQTDPIRSDAGFGRKSNPAVIWVRSSPPTISKAFGATSIPVNGTTSLSFTINNPNSFPLTGIGFSDPFPAGLAVSSAPAGACGGTITAASRTLSLAGATLAANASCTFSVNVKVGSTAGVITNTTGPVTSNESPIGSSSNTATITVIGAPPTISKAFGAASVQANGTTSLSFTINNPNGFPLTGVGFSDPFPAGLAVSSAPAGACGGAVAVASHTLSLAGATLAAGASCTFSVNVKVGPTAGAISNTTNPVTSNEAPIGGSPSNTATITVTGVAPTISKAFGAASVPANGTTSLSFTINNPNGFPLTGVGFSDPFPAGLAVASAPAGACGGAVTVVSGTLSLAGATLAASASCTFSVNVKVGTTTGAISNTAGPVTSNEAPVGGSPSNTATITVTGVAPTISNAFGAASVPVNGTTSLSFTINNPNGFSLTGVGFSDAFPAGLAVLSAPAGACGGAVAVASGTLTLTGGTLAASASCTFSVNIKVGTTTGVISNTTGPVTSNQFPNGSGGGPSNTATITVIALSPPTISEMFGAASIPLKGSVSLTFTITNPNASASLTGVGFTDALPAGLLVSTPNSLTGSCGGGVITATSGSSSVSLAGATLAANASCTFSISVTGTAPGIKDNTTGAVTSNEAGNGGTASASLSVNAPSTTTISLTSSINPSNVGQAVTFTARVTSPEGTPTGVLTFKDGGTTIGTATLATGVVSLTTSSLTLGTHVITATYGGTAIFAASTSPPLIQMVQVPGDSMRLRALQITVSRMQAQASGDAFSDGASGAIADAFSEGGGALITPRGDTLHFNFAADPDADGSSTRHTSDPYDAVSGFPTELRNLQSESSPASRIDDEFAGLAYSRTSMTQTSRPFVPPKEWLLWADVRGTDWNTDPSSGDIRGGQVNAIAGLTRKLTPDFLIGVLGGYENFDYSSETLNGRLKGDGWTLGSYLGWRISPGVRFDAEVGRSGISYDAVSGLAAATYPGDRWLLSGGLTGTYKTQWLEIEPSASVYAIWEHDAAYTDTLGTQQPDNTFSTGRASTGFKMAYPLAWDRVTTLSPYVGLYADSYFSSEAATVLLPNQFVQGWAARTTAGLSYNVVDGPKLSVGGELGGLGSQSFTVWTIRARAGIPF
jgi:hypothetical protein